MNLRRRFINVGYTMSYEEHNEGFTMPEFHYHNDYEIYILESGKRVVSIADEEFTTGAGDVVLFEGGMPHKSRGEGGFSGICIHFSEIYLKRYFTVMAIERIKAIFKIKCMHISEENLNSIKWMTAGFVTDDEDNFLKLARLFEILREASEVYGAEDNKVYSAKTIPVRKADEVFEYVDENYAYIKNVAELAKRFEVSESYLFRIFKDKYNMTLKTYINRLRIKNICHRLKYSDRAIKELALEYGFESYEHFYRVFKKETGCTPTEYGNVKGGLWDEG